MKQEKSFDSNRRQHAINQREKAKQHGYHSQVLNSSTINQLHDKQFDN